MQFGDAVLHVFTALLSGYLALSASFASSLTGALEVLGVTIPQAPEVAHTPEGATVAKSPTMIPSRYEHGGLIPRVLLDDLEYQQAAVAGAGSGRSRATGTAQEIQDALANVLCTYKEGGKVHVTTGSGVFIDEKGIILTNAHVAQFLLLHETREDARCVVRQGDPAQPRYIADLLYISPAWIYANANLIDAEAPAGTGERDFALLYVTEAVSGEMPAIFPSLAFLPYEFRPGDEGRKAYAAGYPAGAFQDEGPRADLQPIVAETSLTEFFTFGSGKPDVMAIAPSAVGEQGASGGPVISADKVVTGLIVTKGSLEQEGEQSLRALTLDYIDRAIQEETGFSLAITLEGNIARRSEIFKSALSPFLARLLENELRN